MDDTDLWLEISSGADVDHAATFLCRPTEEVMNVPSRSACGRMVYDIEDVLRRE
jgi:hypothetical protein